MDSIGGLSAGVAGAGPLVAGVGITVEFRLDTPPSLVTGRSNSDGQISTLVTEQLFRKSQNFHNSYWKILANLCQFFLEFLMIF